MYFVVKMNYFILLIYDLLYLDHIYLLSIYNGNKSHYVYIKDFSRFMFMKSNYKNKKYFCRHCLQCFSSKRVLQEHKVRCLKINCKQSVELKRGTGKFRNYFKQIAAHTECNLETIHITDRDKNTLHNKESQNRIPCSFD